jgi:DNA-binding LytR/AlgR family response regulator
MNESTPLEGRRILVIEDDFLVAQALTAVLEDAGAAVVGPIGWFDEAFDFVQRHRDDFNGAVVDIDLHGVKSYAIADALAEFNIGFVFATGYGLHAVHSDYQHYPRCEKPFNVNLLIQVLAGTH